MNCTILINVVCFKLWEEAGSVAFRTAAESVEVLTTTDEAQVSEAGEDSEPGAASTSSSSSSSEDEGDDSKHDVERHDWITGFGARLFTRLLSHQL